MAYVKNIWVDQEVERPRTYQKIDNADGSFTLVDDFGLVSELGTPVNADNMNHIEDGIEAGSFTKYDENATYSTNDLVTSFLDKNLVIYKSLKDNNIGNPLTDANYWEEISLGGGGQPIGTIYPLACTQDYVPEGSLPCDGTEYTKGQFPSLWDNYIATSLLNTCTYDEYASDLATYGQCAKFAVDTTNNKFKVPTIKDGAVIQQALSDSELGKAYNAGLPNITGEWQYGTTQKPLPSGSFSSASGAFYHKPTELTAKSNIISATESTATATYDGTAFDASLSNPIYGNSDTAQMNAVALRYFVVVANGSINQSQMDWSQWASNLQSKINADHSNDPYPYVKEMYQNDTSWYILYSNGWCEQGGTHIPTSSAINVTINLLKPYINTNYSVLRTNITSNSSNTAFRAEGVSNITTNSFDMYAPNVSTVSKVVWEAKGYIA